MRERIRREVWHSASQIERARLLGRLNADVEACLRAGRAQGFSWAKIGVQLGWSTSTARRWGLLLGVETPDRRKRDEAIKQMRIAGMMWKAIAPRVGMSTTGCAKAGLAALRASPQVRRHVHQRRPDFQQHV
jgi:hypothetical protein